MQNLAQISVFILGAVVVMDHYSYSITPILTALGVGGLAVALALQGHALSNLFGGFYVAVARQIRLEDYIKLNTGEEGYVADIGWRSTTIRSLNSNLIIVPNAKLAQAIVTNYSLPQKQEVSASLLQVGVSYRSDPDQIERMLLEVALQGAKEITGMLQNPPPSVAFDPGFSESSMAFTVSFSSDGVRQPIQRPQRIAEADLSPFPPGSDRDFPFPTRTIYIEGQQRPS